MDPTSLRAVATNLGDIGGSGSATLTTGTVDFDLAMAAANADEVTAADNTAVTVGSVSLTVAHQIISFGMSDLHSIVGAPGQLDLQALAAKMAQAYELRFTDLVCAATDTITANVGTSGADMTVDDFYAATATLQQALVGGPWTAVLAPVQVTDLRTSLRSEGGAMQFMPGTAEQLALKGPGYQGNLLGVDIFSSDSITTSGGNRIGAMFGPGCVAYVEASARAAMPGSIAAPSQSPVYAEFVRAGDPGVSRVIGHAFCSVGLLENSRGVNITTDA
tara:strand:- start:3001 stop:3828 length:828 start_codon:yes stop_codon:yes gene_type:complete